MKRGKKNHRLGEGRKQQMHMPGNKTEERRVRGLSCHAQKPTGWVCCNFIRVSSVSIARQKATKYLCLLKGILKILVTF